MFSAVYNKLKAIKKLNEDGLIKEALSNSQLQFDIVELNKNQLYEQGVFADGSPTGPYSPKTIEGTAQYPGKKQKQQRYDHITFLDTGQLYSTIKFGNLATEFKIIGDTVKNGIDLEKRDGKIIGLTKESISQVREWVRPLVLKLIRQKI